MKLLYIFLEDDYKHIQKGSYQFDDEFIVDEFNPENSNRIIKLINNKNYHNPFNNTIQNITCIVGKNGTGKTTFFELIIAPLLWRLDGSILEGKIHFLFYDGNNFFIQSYTTLSNNWTLYVDDEIVDIYKNIRPKTDKIIANNSSNSYRSVLPHQMNLIFHSLSPFDRIYTLLKQKLSSSNSMIKHYKKRFKYIGIKQIENDEINYEYMTLINLLTLFVNTHAKKMFKKIGYEFEDINISLNNDYFSFEVDIPEFEDISLDFQDLTNKHYDQLKGLFEFYDYFDAFDENFYNYILYKNLDISSRVKFKRFLSFISKEFQDDNIVDGVKKFLDNIQNFIDKKTFFKKAQYDFLLELINSKDEFNHLKDLEEKSSLKKILKEKKLFKYLQNLKKLSIRNILEFELNLYKNSQSVNYFRLSSGEKTLLSYFSNIVGRIKDILQIQQEDESYKKIENRTFLILIDEVELHLHPEWQRNFIKYINDFFKYKENIKIQFVIATHSPFVVSDIYDQNIIYLGEKDNGSKTFGGNIFDIFKDDFYVSNTIGSFSESIIQELSEFLYFLFITKKAKDEANYFIFRDFFDLMYIDTNKKDEENIKLIEEAENYLSDNVENKKFEKIESNQYLEVFRNSKKKFFKIAGKIINNIGEEVVSQHLKKMYAYLQD